MVAAKILLYVLGALVLATLAVVIYLLSRMVVLSAQRASFPAWVITPGNNHWTRGVALYGQANLAWYKLVAFVVTPDLRLRRTALEIIGRPTVTKDGLYTVVRLASADGIYTLALGSGDAAGLISWVNSALPGVTQQ